MNGERTGERAQGEVKWRREVEKEGKGKWIGRTRLWEEGGWLVYSHVLAGPTESCPPGVCIISGGHSGLCPLLGEGWQDPAGAGASYPISRRALPGTRHTPPPPTQTSKWPVQPWSSNALGLGPSLTCPPSTCLLFLSEGQDSSLGPFRGVK